MGYCWGTPALEIAPACVGVMAGQACSHPKHLRSIEIGLTCRALVTLACRPRAFTTCVVKYPSVGVAEDWGAFKPFLALIKFMAGH